MLVLSRKEGQVIHIGDEITLTIAKIQGKSIRIGIDAPDHVRILRGELADWCEIAHYELEARQEEVAV